MVFPALVLLVAAAHAVDPDACEAAWRLPQGTTLQPLYAEGETGTWYATLPDDSAALVQRRPAGSSSMAPHCERWGVGPEVRSVDAQMVAGGPAGQRMTLHGGDVGIDGVVVVRAGDAVLAAGPFFLFCEPEALTVLDLGLDQQLVTMGCVRPEVVVGRDGMSYRAVGWHLLAARGGLVDDVATSTGHVLPTRGDCMVGPSAAFEVVEGGTEPQVRGLWDIDPPAWSAAALAGRSVNAYAVTWRWNPSFERFLQAPDGAGSRVVTPVTRCATP